MHDENSVRGIPDAAARLNPYVADRLIPFVEGLTIIGVKSRTSAYKLIADGELSPVHRGRHVFFLESDLQTYITRLASSRGTVSHGDIIEKNKRASASMIAGKTAKRAAAAKGGAK